MTRYRVVGMMAMAAMLALAVAAQAQSPTATIRTHTGESYTVSDPVVEIFYTIGELKEKKPMEERDKFAPAINLTTTTNVGKDEQAAGGEKEAEPKMLRGRRELSEIPVVRQGVEIRVPLAQVKSFSVSRTRVEDSALPPYVSVYRYVPTVVLANGDRLTGDRLSLGTAIFRGSSPAGEVRIPWENVASVSFER